MAEAPQHEVVSGRPLADTAVRQRFTGTVEVLATQERTEPPFRFDATVTDGTAELVLRFLGRRRVPGLRAGAVVAVSGRLVEHLGTRCLLNPGYDLVVPCGDSGTSS